MTIRIALGDIWEETIAFVRRELALLLPVALIGFGVPLVMLLLAVPVGETRNGALVPGTWMLWLLPCGLLSMFGSLAISALALRPGGSVGEALLIAIRRLPLGIGLALLHFGFQVLLAMPLAALAGIDIALSGHVGILPLLGNVAFLAIMVWLFVRLLPIWALLADRPQAPWRTVRACFALTAKVYRTLLLVRVVAGCAGVITLSVVLVPLGALTALLGLATGAGAAATILSYVLTAFVFALLAATWTVYVARLYRRLAPSIGI